MDFTPGWYIVKRAADTPCEILNVTDAGTIAAVTNIASSPDLADRRVWGPFASPQEAIAKRVGLIRAGKCQPQ